MTTEQARNDLLECVYAYFPQVKPGVIYAVCPLVEELKVRMDALQQAVMEEYYKS